MSVMKPIIGITMGDPAGIGPEITVKALEQKKIYESCRPLVIGDCSFLEWAKEYRSLRTFDTSGTKPRGRVLSSRND